MMRALGRLLLRMESSPNVHSESSPASPAVAKPGWPRPPSMSTHVPSRLSQGDRGILRSRHIPDRDRGSPDRPARISNPGRLSVDMLRTSRVSNPGRPSGEMAPRPAIALPHTLATGLGPAPPQLALGRLFRTRDPARLSTIPSSGSPSATGGAGVPRLPIVGAQVPRRGSLLQTLATIHDAGGDAFQTFVSSPKSGRISPRSYDAYLADAPAVRAYLAGHGMQLWIHSAYTNNLSQPPGPKQDYVVGNVVKELEIAGALGAGGLVIHTGRWVSSGTAQAGIAHMRDAILRILAAPEGRRCPLLIEIPAGQGTELFPDPAVFLAFVRDMRARFPVARRRLRICLDTAHLWASGSLPPDSRGLVALFRRMRPMLIHMNNSAVASGSHVDRHAPPYDAEGQIGAITMAAVAHAATTALPRPIPMIMETPGKRLAMEIAWVKRMATM